MDIKYITGNLLDAPEPIIIHGCNAQGVMGSGVAKAIRDKYPMAYAEYETVHRIHGLRLGEVVWGDCGQHVVGNAITQKYYGRDPIRYCSYEAIARAIEGVNIMARSSGIEAVGMPLIGAGLAHGSWKIISSIIEVEAQDFQPVVYLIDGVIPTS